MDDGLKQTVYVLSLATLYEVIRITLFRFVVVSTCTMSLVNDVNKFGYIVKFLPPEYDYRLKYMKSVDENCDEHSESLPCCDVTFVMKASTSEELHCWFAKFKVCKLLQTLCALLYIFISMNALTTGECVSLLGTLPFVPMSAYASQVCSTVSTSSVPIV